MQDEVVRVVLRMEKTMHGDQKGVIYYRSRAACQELADKLGYDFYHSGIEDNAHDDTVSFNHIWQNLTSRRVYGFNFIQLSFFRSWCSPCGLRICHLCG